MHNLVIMGTLTVHGARVGLRPIAWAVAQQKSGDWITINWFTLFNISSM